MLIPDDIERFHGMSIDDFLTGGPDHFMPLLITAEFDRSFRDVMRYNVHVYGQSVLAPSKTLPVTPCLAVPGMAFVACRSRGILVADIDTGTIAGCFIGPWLGVAKDHRGRDLGPELLVERLARGAPHGPQGNAERAIFTPAGARNRQKALDLLQSPAYRDRKRRALAAAGPMAVPLDLTPFGGRFLGPGDDGCESLPGIDERGLRMLGVIPGPAGESLDPTVGSETRVELQVEP